MANYRKMYTLLFNAVTDALESLHRGETIDAEYTLKTAQAACERLYIASPANPLPLPRAHVQHKE